MNRRLKKKPSIRTRILLSFLGIITSIFVVVAVVFNVLVDRYIEVSSNGKLREAKEILNNNDDLFKEKIEHGGKEDKILLENNYIRRLEEKVKKAKYKTETDIMIIDNNYNIVFPKDNDNFINRDDEYNNILDDIKNKENIDLDSDKNNMITVQEKKYYILHEKMQEVEDGEYYLIVFINVSSIIKFSKQINSVLILIMCIAFLLSLVIAIVLSNKIARPIKRLCVFAQKMGEGNFQKSDVNFADKEIYELANVMNKAAEELDKYDKEQKIFFQNASHELRTPLMSIKGYAEAIKYNILDKDEATTVILEESDRLVELIEELLYVSKVDNITKDYILVEHDIRELLSNCCVKEKAKAIKLGIEFYYEFDEQPALVKCDEKSMYRAFINIIDNALRYAKTQIKIKCKNIDDIIEIVIENDGEKIAESDFPYIFDRFYKGNKGKHGIGLSIVKSIISKHGGEIYAQNTFNGVSFTVLLKKNI